MDRLEGLIDGWVAAKLNGREGQSEKQLARWMEGKRDRQMSVRCMEWMDKTR